jgi:NADPH2:quinone reductase
MKSAILHTTGGPEVLEIVEEPVPSPAAGEVLIRTQAIAVSGPDMLIRKGIYKWGPPLPANPGNELAGIIEAVGAGVTGMGVGQAVLLSSRELPVRGGCYTQFRAVPATAVHLLPGGIRPEQAVVLPSYLVAHAMLANTVSTRTRSIFVNGAGGTIGGALTELAKVRGLSVIGSAGSEEKAEYARSKGADHIIYHRTESLLDRVMEITNGRGVDISFDHVIGPRFIECLRMLADFGTAVAYNSFSPAPDADVFDEMRQLSLRSPKLMVFSTHTYDHDLAAMRQLMRELIDMLAAGAIHPALGAQLPFDDVVKAHQMFDRGETIGKIVMIP